jgi:FkbM family methyltransferase
MTSSRVIRYDLKRVAQTPRTFRNWPTLLASMVGEKVHRGAETLTFVTRSGVRLTTPNVPGARLPMYEQFADDTYQLEWVLGPRAAGPVQILDVGAHVGAFATNAASARPDVRVECYEPSPSSAAYLRRNVSENRLADRIRVHEAALAATAGTARLDDNSSGSVHNGLVRDDGRLVRGEDSPTTRHVIEVETRTFDDAVAAAPGPVDVVKMDCEGGEYQLVYASAKQSWAPVQRIVMEYHPVQGESWDELRTWFEGLGFRVVREKTDAESPGLGAAWLERVPGRD